MSTLPPFSDDEIFRQISYIIEQFKVLECAECAEAIKEWLKYNRINGTLIKISPLDKADFILSERWDGGRSTISQNGLHYGIEVRGKVFDNLSLTGLSREEWIADFYCAIGEFTIEEIEKF
ncbi:hypothetical protein IQ264_26145 [Phormidium sp. LEGE 05292]|uniref:papain fold toxin domain-containing protein n=1 Tax=[Phormidium] sp. LEGE 05292 TaxID=767427 RepID=UPI00187DF485|nr:papain fold toxin domain-containing protein [Phormidium sp. LEGE 05292]MBE9228898.1 hypothetical protein [Phormidium sp. LEGE 05292]